MRAKNPHKTLTDTYRPMSEYVPMSKRDYFLVKLSAKKKPRKVKTIQIKKASDGTYKLIAVTSFILVIVGIYLYNDTTFQLVYTFCMGGAFTGLIFLTYHWLDSKQPYYEEYEVKQE